MTAETRTIPVRENERVTLTAPQKFAIKVRQVDKNTIQVYLVSEDHSRSGPEGKNQGELPEDVQVFSHDQAIEEYVRKAIEVARTVFAEAEHVTASLKKDEYGDCYVDIAAVIPDDPEVEAERYSTCVEKWASFIPPHAGDKIQLSTSWM